MFSVVYLISILNYGIFSYEMCSNKQKKKKRDVFMPGQLVLYMKLGFDTFLIV